MHTDTHHDLLERTAAWTRVDFTPTREPPRAWRVVLATVAAIGLSLLADAALVAIGTRVFKGTAGYQHFGFADYAKLTIIGIVFAGAGWPIVARISSAPKWLFLRLAVLVSAVLLLPDLYLLMVGQPPKAVAVLVAMHVAIAVITYCCLVWLAPLGRRIRRGVTASPRSG
jgi:hypothetical protein